MVGLDSLPPPRELSRFDAVGGVIGTDRFIIRAIHRLEGGSTSPYSRAAAMVTWAAWSRGSWRRRWRG